MIQRGPPAQRADIILDQEAPGGIVRNRLRLVFQERDQDSRVNRVFERDFVQDFETAARVENRGRQDRIAGFRGWIRGRRRFDIIRQQVFRIVG